MKKSVLAVCLSPTFQNTLVFDSFNEDEVNRASMPMHIDASGKGLNVIRVLGQLETPSVCLTQLGGPRVEEYLSLCKKQDMHVHPVLCDASIRTCTTVINKAAGTSTELVENAHEVGPETDKAMRKAFSELVKNHDALIISGTKAPGFAADLFPWMVEEARKNGLLVIIDIKGSELKACLEKRPDIIKPNLSEFAATFFEEGGLNVLENEDNESLKKPVEERAKAIYEKYGTRTILTRGRFDTWAFDGKSLIIVPAPKVTAPIVNTIGCGDTMTAGLAHALMEGRSFSDAIAFGMQCATSRATHLNHGI